SSETGLFDKLNLDGKIMGIYGMNDIRNDHGAFVIIYVPKILGQSHKTVKKLINAELEKLRSGNIDKEFFEAIKLNLIKEHEQELENFQSRAFIIGQMFVQNKDWRDIISYSKKVQSINIEDIQKIAGKYFNKNYLSFESKMGFPKKEKLEKPGFDPIIPKNTEAKSEYMAKFEQMPNTQIKPEIINFEKDALTFDINKNSKLYYVKQDINDIFKLNIKFHSGLFTNNKYSQLSEYLKLIGTKNTDLENFNKNLQKLGSTFSVTATNNDFIISIDGFNKNLRETMLLINDLITNPQSDEKKLKNLIQNKKFEDKFEKTDADNLSDMLLKFVMYEEKSEYLNRLSASEIKKIKSDDLLNLLTLTITKPCSIHYSGNLDEKELFSILQKELPLKENSENTNYPIIRDKKTYNENTIFFLDEPKAVQSKINFYISGNKNSLEERSFGNAFNQYFGAGMSSLIFQEIREFRSLAYSAFGNYYFGENLEKPGYFRAFIGTQSDKTIEAISIMDSLITQMPKKENRIKQIQSTLIQSINSNIPNKRQLSSTIEQYILSGYKEDPKILDLKIYENLNFDEIIKFYNKNIENRPIVITIVGNKKNINMENLAKFGKIIEVNIKQIAKN
ncbi:MAG: insulinase family protein, partial [Bacteroidales bacterium]|nr:insulinase family protein [Bacteroidales bacterium]